MSAALLRNIIFNVASKCPATHQCGWPHYCWPAFLEMYKSRIIGLVSSGIKISVVLVKNKLIHQTLSRFIQTQILSRTGPKMTNIKFKIRNNTKNDNKIGFVAVFSACSTNDSVNSYMDSGITSHEPTDRHRLAPGLVQ